MFPVNGSLRTAPRFPRSGPGKSSSPMSQVLLRCYDFPPRISGHLFASLPGSTRSSSLRVSQLALPVVGGDFRARAIVQPATRSAGALARGRERDLPGSQTIHPVPLPRSATPAEPTIPSHSHGIVVAAPALPTAKASALDEFRGSITRLQHPLPTLHEWCCHHPCKACFRLAGSPLPGESRTLWIATKGFRSSSSSSGLGLAQGKFHFEPPFTSFDHLVGEQLQCVGYLDAEQSRRLRVDDELEFGGLQHRQFGWLRALEDLTGIDADLTKTVRSVSRIAHQPSHFDALASGMSRRNPVVRRERRQLDAAADEEPVAADEKGVGLVAHEGGEGRLDLAPRAGIEELNLQSDGTRSFRYVPQRGLGRRSIRRIDQHDNTKGLGHQVVQEPQPLGGGLLSEKINTGGIGARPSETGDEAELDRVFTDAEHDRDRCGCGFGSQSSNVTGGGGDSRHAAADEVGHERWQ